MKLSDNIMWFGKLGFHPAKSQLEEWSEQAKKLEDRGDALAAQNSRQRAIIDSQRAEIQEHARNTNTVALNKHIAKLTEENQQHKNTTRQLEDQNKNLEAALVKAETDVKERDEQIDRLKRMYDTDITARNADVVRLIDQRNHWRIKLEQMTQRNDNQSGFIRGYQEEVRKLREQLEAEKTKVGPVQDIYKDSKLEVRLLNDGAVEVLEYPGNYAAGPRRLRKTHALVDWRTKATRREVSIDDVDFKNMQVLGTITEYGSGGKPLFVFRNVPINGLVVAAGA